jgi:hypothetical protein
MFQVIDNMEVSCVVSVKVRKCTHLERSKIALSTVNKSRLITLTIQHDINASISFMSYHGEYLRQTSANVLSLELHPVIFQQLGDFGGCTLQLIPVIKHTTSDRLIANCGEVGNPCNSQP